MNTNQFILIMILVLMLFQVFYFYPKISEPFGTKFSKSDEMLQSTSRTGFVIFGVFYPLILAFIFLIMPANLHRFSQKWWNIPNKEYWLAEDRKQETFKYIALKMSLLGIVFSGMILISQQVYINKNVPAYSIDIPGMNLAIGLFVFFLFIWVGDLILHFRRANR